MRLRFLLLLLLPLAACEPALNSGPRVDLISSSRYTTGNRRLTTPGDTIATKVYARQENSDAPLKQLRIEVEYSPQPTPFIYDALYDPTNPVKRTLVYIDSSFTRSDFAFQSVQAVRTTAGLETWHYNVTDSNNNTGRRSYKLRLPRTDSAATYHSYSVVLQAPATIDPARRSFLALREGLAMPKFMVRTDATNQSLVDLVYYPGSPSSAPVLATVQDAGLNLSSRWPNKRATELRISTITATEFAAITSAAPLATGFNLSAPTVTRTPPLVKDNVLAFQTPEGNSGLIRVLSINTTGIPSVTLQVLVAK